MYTYARTQEEAEALSTAIERASGKPSLVEHLGDELHWRYRVADNGLDYVVIRNIEDALGMFGPAK